MVVNSRSFTPLLTWKHPSPSFWLFRLERKSVGVFLHIFYSIVSTIQTLTHSEGSLLVHHPITPRRGPPQTLFTMAVGSGGWDALENCYDSKGLLLFRLYYKGSTFLVRLYDVRYSLADSFITIYIIYPKPCHRRKAFNFFQQFNE